MNKILTIILFTFIATLSSTSFADKQDKHKEKLGSDKLEMKHEKYNAEYDELKKDKKLKMMKGEDQDAIQNNKEKLKHEAKEKEEHHERQIEMEREQKELDKGSEQGLESREDRKKWWQFKE